MILGFPNIHALKISVSPNQKCASQKQKDKLTLISSSKRKSKASNTNPKSNLPISNNNNKTLTKTSKPSNTMKNNISRDNTLYRTCPSILTIPTNWLTLKEKCKCKKTNSKILSHLTQITISSHKQNSRSLNFIMKNNRNIKSKNFLDILINILVVPKVQNLKMIWIILLNTPTEKSLQF